MSKESTAEAGFPTCPQSGIPRLFLLLASLSLFFAAAQARVLYVAQDGSGDYTTIQPALDVCADYDTIAIGFGTYGELLTLSNKNHVAVMGAGIGTGLERTNVPSLNLSDCDGCEVWSIAFGSGYVQGIGNIVRRCSFGSWTCLVGDPCYGNDVTLVTVGSSSDDNIFIDDVFQGYGACRQCSQWPPIYACKSVIHLSPAGNGQISGCQFLGGTGTSALQWPYSAGNVCNVTNCTFNSVTAISGSGQLTFENNILWNSGLGGDPLYQQYSYNACNGELPGTNNIVLTESPFVNVDAGDYHLSETSPCWDAGDPYIHDRYDRGHNASISDMGCYGGMTPFFDGGLPPFPYPIVTSLQVTPVVTVGDNILIQSTGRSVPRY